MFSDANSIAVDYQGRIYVGEYTSGRVQVFDANGHFISQWIAGVKGETNAWLFGLAADGNDGLYVAKGEFVYHHEAQSGKLLSRIEYADVFSVADVKTLPYGGIVVAWQPSLSDDIALSFSDSTGRIERKIRSPIIEHNAGRGFSNAHLAVEGSGDFYVIDHGGTAVFKFSNDGTYQNRFGSEGTEPGQFIGTLGIAVNGQGDVYVSGAASIQAFDASGRYLGFKIDTDRTVRGMAFDLAGDLFAVADDQVTKFHIGVAQKPECTSGVFINGKCVEQPMSPAKGIGSEECKSGVFINGACREESL
jgi:DNA-binding beta-propeller fold protein YncE